MATDRVPANQAPVLEHRGPYAVGLATLLSLLAGRGFYRLSQLAATVVLLPIWGATYGTYAAAVASSSWLIALVSTGPEKTALKLVPRARRTAGLITQALLAFASVLPVPLVVAFGALLAVHPSGAATVYIGAAAWQLATGCTLLLVGLHRAAGRVSVDARTFLIMSATQLVMLALAGVGGLQPVGYVAGLTAVQVGLNVVLVAALGRPSLRIRQRPGYLRRLAWTAALMGGGDVCLYLSNAVLFAMLAASTWVGQVGPLFVLEVIWFAAVNLLIYVLRVYAPRTSLRQAGRAGHQGRQRAARLGRVAVAGNAAWLVATVGVLVLAPAPAALPTFGDVLLWTVLLLTRTPALITLIWAGYLLENTDAAATRITGVAALVGLATATVAGVPLVAQFGAVGLIASFAVADLAQALVLATMARSVRSARPQDRRVVAGTGG
ncbi:MAG TPA: hypothetical protein VF163_02770 [Micromonosporaceae bacterium]